jgi:hypothetical protein
MFVRAHHWSLTWATYIMSSSSRPFSLRSVLMLYSHLRLLFRVVSSHRFSTKDILYIHLFHACYIRGCIQKFTDWPGRLEWELQMVQLSATRCSCIAILWVSLVSFAAITLYVASERVITKVSVYFVIDSVRKLLGTPSYMSHQFRPASWLRTLIPE